MKILFYLGHPAHYHLFKHTISALRNKNHVVYILIKKKDILETLLAKSGFEYSNILPEGRKDSKIGIAFGLLKRDIRIYQFCLKNRPDIMLGTSTEITHVGKILNIPSINVNEDDFDAVPLFSKLGYPWSHAILAPDCCRTGKWEPKTINYRGYHELAYLHPNLFDPDKEAIRDKIDFDRPYFIVRFAQLTAHHDQGKTGINAEIAQHILEQLKPYGTIYITSERELEIQFEPYRIQIDPENIHHALYYADMYIGDSQTMAAEAAVLGTPSLRFNDFVGKLGYLEELEHTYGLTYGIKTDTPEKLFQRIDELLKIGRLKEEWQKKRKRMLSEKIDVTAFFVWFIENYPNSIREIKDNPNIQFGFLGTN